MHDEKWPVCAGTASQGNQPWFQFETFYRTRYLDTALLAPLDYASKAESYARASLDDNILLR